AKVLIVEPPPRVIELIYGTVSNITPFGSGMKISLSVEEEGNSGLTRPALSSSPSRPMNRSRSPHAGHGRSPRSPHQRVRSVSPNTAKAVEGDAATRPSRPSFLPDPAIDVGSVTSFSFEFGKVGSTGIKNASPFLTVAGALNDGNEESLVDSKLSSSESLVLIVPEVAEE
ncbi:hypothetical protein HDU76_009224, partial [Blyttiomyces sp. JEL0837]